MSDDIKPTSDPEAAAEYCMKCGEEHAVGQCELAIPTPLTDENAFVIHGEDEHTNPTETVVTSVEFAQYLERELTRLRAEVQALREDKERLDWLERETSKAPYFDGRFYTRDDQSFSNLRDAIDASMESEANE